MGQSVGPRLPADWHPSPPKDVTRYYFCGIHPSVAVVEPFVDDSVHGFLSAARDVEVVWMVSQLRLLLLVYRLWRALWRILSPFRQRKRL